MAPDIYRALESVSIASALSTALTIYPCQIRVHQRWQSKLQLSTVRKKEWFRLQRTVHSRWFLPVNTVIHTTLVGLEPTTFRLLVRRATSSSATNSARDFVSNSKASSIIDACRNLWAEIGRRGSWNFSLRSYLNGWNGRRSDDKIEQKTGMIITCNKNWKWRVL